MKRHIIILLLFPVLLLAGCAKETLVDDGVYGADNLEATLTLRVMQDAPSKASTRAMTEEDENEIGEIDVLVFSKATAGDSDAASATYFYRAETVRIITDDTDSAEKSFRVTLKKSDDYQRLVVFANCRSAINSIEAAQGANGFDGMTYTQVMAALEMSSATAWNSADNTYTPLPMWGQNSFKKFTDAAAAADVIQLYRSLARVDVVVDAAAQSDFKLNGVWLYNPSVKGLLAPSAANWNGTKATAPSLPAGYAGTSGSSFSFTTMTEANEALEGVIYAFEAPTATSNTSTGATCLVVRGSWNNETNSYYRIDFHDGTKFLPLLRNFQYIISIDEVTGRGYGSLNEALAAGFTAMTTTTQMWNGGDQGSVVWDGKHYLSVSANEFTFYPEATSGITTITAATNYSDGTTGWKATLDVKDSDNAVSGTNWITIDAGYTTGAGDGTARPIQISILQNTVNKDRTATLTVTAGRLVQKIVITQKYQGLLSLDVGDVEVVFSAKNPGEFELPIDWEPAANPVTLELIHAGSSGASVYSQLSGYTSGVIFSGGETLATTPTTVSDEDGQSLNGGTANLKMKPDAQTLAIFAERRSILKVTSSSGDARPDEVKTILLRQFDYAIQASGTGLTNSAMSCQLETTYSLTIKANGQWALDTSSAGELTNFSITEGEPNTSGVKFSFKTGSTEGGSYKLVFYLKEYPNVKHEVTINQYRLDPNCYIVNPGGSPVRIPIRKVYDAWNNDVDLNGTRAGDAGAMEYGNFTTGLLWQDEAGLIPAGNISSLIGTGENAYFTVTANTAGIEGNAVVFLKENGVIRWSWHIWVLKDSNDPTKLTTYTNPTTGAIIMDRNLGATTNFAPTSTSDVRSHGLFYQWGRKDPFPGAAATNSNTPKVVYNQSGTSLTEGINGVQKTEVMVARNLAGAIENPLTFYFSTSSVHNTTTWYSHKSNNIGVRTDLWNNSAKTIYDPCPEGWKIPYAHVILSKAIYNGSDFKANLGMPLYHQNEEPLGFFSMPGHRVPNSGNLYSVGIYVRGWSYPDRATHTISNAALVTSAGTQDAYGASVRCVKIQ